MWTISGRDAWNFRLRLPYAKLHSGARDRYPVLGYRGISVSGQGDDSYEVVGAIDLERWLLSTAPRGIVPIQVMDYVISILDRVENESSVSVAVEEVESNGHVQMKSFSKVFSGVTPVVGPDTIPDFNVTADDKGYFITYQYDNNCYNYGSDIATNTFAQPGRGTGHHWEYNTCESIRKAAEFDGLVWVGEKLPSPQPEHGHYIALFIWPDTNFHWVRKDSNGMWSHKPGGTQVRNTDNTGKTVSDPSVANFSPWSQFCGYMNVVPSKTTIN